MWVIEQKFEKISGICFFLDVVAPGLAFASARNEVKKSLWCLWCAASMVYL